MQMLLICGHVLVAGTPICTEAGEGVRPKAAPVNPSMLAAATRAHQASLQAFSPEAGAAPSIQNTNSQADSNLSGVRGHLPGPLAQGSAMQRDVAACGNFGSDVEQQPQQQQQQQQHAGNDPQPASILRQTAAALGLWEQLHETASTPSTVLAPQSARLHAQQAPAVSASTDQSAA